MKLTATRQTIIHLLLAIGVLTLLTGCVPATFSLVPEFRGRVVDASHTPVPAASVRLSNVKGSPIHLDETVTCDASGRFVRNEETKWGLFIVGMDNFGTRFQAVAHKDTQQSAIRVIPYPWSRARLLGLGSPATIDLGDLQIDEVK